MHVLIVKVSSLGDVIHTLPALTDAERAIPNIKFDWVIEEAFAEIPVWHTAVNKVIPVAFRRWKKNILKINPVLFLIFGCPILLKQTTQVLEH